MEMDLKHMKGKDEEYARETTIELLRICNKGGSLKELMRDLVLFFQRLTGCEAVGVRMRQGEDFPYYETRGFSGEFVLAENHLCAFDQAGELVRDGSGHPALDCMCGNILRGRFDPSKPFFSVNGSFWSSCTTELLANTTDADRKAKTRNRCNGEGYESVALIPLRSQGETFGLFQFNDKRRGRFTAEKIALLEDLVTYVAIGLAKQKTDEVLRSSEERYRSLFDNMVEGYAYCQMIYDGDRPVDFIYLNVNQAFGTLTGLRDVVGKKVSEVIPGVRESDPRLFEIYGKVALTGKPERFEIYVEALRQWFSISVYSQEKEHFVAVFDVITERKRSEEALKESEEKFRLIFDNANDGILLADTESMKFEMGNRKICEMLGYSEEEILRLPILDICPGKDLPNLLAGFQEAKGGMRTATDIPMKRKDGSVFFADIASSLIDFKGKRLMLGICRDLTHERMLQKQLQTSQKMESVGTLAGGIAHDFNNSLTGIIGFGELLRVRVAGDEQSSHDLDEILRCAERAATLTRQLLTFACRQIIEPVDMDLSALVADLMNLIGKAVGEHIEVKTSLEKNVLTIHADRGQIEQVIMNLCLNARDAMPEGGQLVVGTKEVYLEEEYVRQNPYMRTGRYALLAVSDTGIGMDEKTRERVFEPFFTTKGPDKGTGLGLAMVYGIVQQHGGFIHLYSEPGKGTAFKVYFPVIEASPNVATEKRKEEILRGGKETILLAEDEEAIRLFIERTLKGLGYTVLLARNGEEAIGIFRGEKEIALAILDVIMPRKGGKETFEEMRKANPNLKVIFMSGYSANAIHDSFVLLADTPFLQKPFGPTILARKIREVLDTQ